MQPKLENAKDTRVSLVMPAQLRDGLKKVAYIQQKSFNGFCCDVLALYLDKHKADVKKYDENFKKE